MRGYTRRVDGVDGGGGEGTQNEKLTKELFWQQTGWLEHEFPPTPITLNGLQVRPLFFQTPPQKKKKKKQFHQSSAQTIVFIQKEKKTYTMVVRSPKTTPNKPSKRLAAELLA